MAKQLFVDEEPPEGFIRLRTMRHGSDEDGLDGMYARLYKIIPKTAE